MKQILKLIGLFFLFALWTQGQTTGVFKGTTTNDITGDLRFPSGRTLTLNGVLSGTPTGGTLNLSNVTLTLPPGFGSVWGSITGTLSAQTDLQTALNARQPLDAELTAIAGLASTGLIARTGAGTAAVRTITGTTDQITVTNGDGVAGNPTFALPTALTSINSITASAATDLTLTAGSGSMSVRLQPTGGGIVSVGDGGSGNWAVIQTLPTNAAASSAYSSAPLGTVTNTNPIWYAGHRFSAHGQFAIWKYGGASHDTNLFTIQPTSGNILLGTTTDSSNGRLQLATHTTGTGGIGFGTDTVLYRSSAGNLVTQSNSAAPAFFSVLANGTYGGGSGSLILGSQGSGGRAWNIESSPVAGTYGSGLHIWNVTDGLIASFGATTRINLATVSTNTTSGSLVNNGGFGNAGAAWFGGGVNSLSSSGIALYHARQVGGAFTSAIPMFDALSENTTTSAANHIIGGSRSGDTTHRFIVSVDGTMNWSSGAAAYDTGLYRSAVGTLRTDAALSVGTTGTFGGSLNAVSTTSTPSITGRDNGAVAVGGAFAITSNANGDKWRWGLRDSGGALTDNLTFSAFNGTIWNSWFSINNTTGVTTHNASGDHLFGNSVANNSITVTRTGANASSLSLQAFTDIPAINYVGTTQALRFIANGTERFRLSPNHNLLIGTTTDVAGSNGLVVTGTIAQGGATISTNQAASFRLISGPTTNIYSNNAADMAGSGGISVNTYGVAKWTGFSAGGAGQGLWGTSSDGGMRVASSGGGSVFFGQMSNLPFTNATSTFTEYGRISSTQMVINANTASTSTTSGALVVTGGAGFGSAITLPATGVQMRFFNGSGINDVITTGTIDGNTGPAINPFHGVQISRGTGSGATLFDVFDNTGTFPTNSYVRVRNATGTMFSLLGAGGTASFTPLPRTSGAAAYFTVSAPADTTQTASTEAIGVRFNGASRQWATGALTLQREHVLSAPTNTFVAASTITTAVNLDVADPIAGTNATHTNNFGIRANRIQVTNQLVSTQATGTAPFVVASTTNVANLNASSLNGATFAAPGAIGSTTAGTGAFTSLSSTLPIRNGGLVRTTADVVVTSNTTLANVAGLSVTLAAATNYKIHAWIPTTAAAAGGIKASLGGTATVTSMVYEGSIDNGTKTRASALGTVVATSAAATAGTIEIKGTITSNAAGTLTVQFAQDTSNASASTVLRGAFLEVLQINN